MRRVRPLPASPALLVVTGIGSGVVAWLDLLGTGTPAFGDASLFSYGAVLAFLVPAAVVARVGYDRYLRQPSWARWPDVVIGAAAVALAASVLARVVGEGGLPGLLAAAVGAAGIALVGVRIRS